ncbi:hypothetical protein A244_22256 [Pseudomonas syringae pv. actinidiae ICMP 18807]|uniref:Uncharacterized protein n=1 Tax=Pseudomonas syringae pv. actinidiae ICMP 18807 TaxID=1194404 RepID=S6V7D0_PSESF|nr:hypothetical protein A244_22256 [Pseudomonas syringae pv. actinidiae ICMP 18807]
MTICLGCLVTIAYTAGKEMMSSLEESGMIILQVAMVQIHMILMWEMVKTLYLTQTLTPRAAKSMLFDLVWV